MYFSRCFLPFTVISVAGLILGLTATFGFILFKGSVRERHNDSTRDKTVWMKQLHNNISKDPGNGSNSASSPDNDIHDNITIKVSSSSDFRIGSRQKRSSVKHHRFVEGIEQLKSPPALKGRVHQSFDYSQQVSFIVYEKSKPTNPMSVIRFRAKSKVAFYVHGWWTATLDDGVKMRNALFQGADDVDYVVIVDWRQLSLPCTDNIVKQVQHYKISALESVPFVASLTKDFLLKHLHENHYVYIVGFSLGGHIAGTAARLTSRSNGGFTIDRVTGLEPAGPIFERAVFLVYPKNTTNTIRRTDATFVDIIHLSREGELGMVNPAGHLDIYVWENFCAQTILGSTCRHHKAIEVFIASLEKCSLITCPKKGKCSDRTLSSGGYLADRYEGRGSHDLDLRITNRKVWNDPNCSESLNVYLPAKNRICKAKSSSCGKKPFLTQCDYSPCGDEYGVCSVHPDFKISGSDATAKNQKRFGNSYRFSEVSWMCLNGRKGRAKSLSKIIKGGKRRKKTNQLRRIN